jgi:hypothetical protein
VSLLAVISRDVFINRLVPGFFGNYSNYPRLDYWKLKRQNMIYDKSDSMVSILRLKKVEDKAFTVKVNFVAKTVEIC